MSIQVRDLRYRRGNFELYVPDLEFATSKITAIVGPNGAGKTTFLKCLSALLPPSEGTIRVDGLDLRSLSESARARRLAFVPQEHTAAFNYSVRDFVLMGRAAYLPLFGTPSARDLAVADEALAFVGFSQPIDRPSFHLSSGERRLVLIARALAQRTDILVLDEPTTFLDPRHETEVMKITRRLAIEHKKTILVTLHDLDMAVRYADTLVFMKEGRIVAHGRPDEILSEDILQQVYEIPMKIISHAGRRFIVK
jgi:iron complex transport system ATP-binding protein